MQENVLLDSDGHIRITDFGLAKGDMNDDVNHRTNSLIGTMEYMAPEIVAGVCLAITDVPITGFYAFSMACAMLGVQLRCIACNDSYCNAYCNESYCMAASAPFWEDRKNARGVLHQTMTQ